MQTEWLKRPGMGYAVALGVVFLAVLMRCALPGVLTATPFLAFYPAVAAAAILGGFGPGMLATLLTAFCYMFWFDPTPGKFPMNDAADWLRIALFISGGGATSLLARMQHRSQDAEHRRGEELRDSEERLQLAQKASHLGIWDWNLISGEALLSEECFRLWGLEPQGGPIVQDWFALIHPDDRDRTRKLFEETVERGVLLQGEYRIVRPNGELRWLMTLGNVIERDASRRATHLSGITLDVTDRKLLEEELKSARDSAERAKESAEQANQAKDHFLAVLSHELRTPLTPVVLGVSMLQNRPDLEPQVRETLEMIRRHVEMEAGLIDDLLDVTRIARGKIELNRMTVQLCTIIQRAVEVCEADIETRRLHFGVDWGSSAPYWVEADVPRLQQVFWNLLKNAIKFTPHGGCVGIRCRPNESHIIVEVNDSGIGIEPEALSRVFNVFEQAERSITRQFGGLGLGLAISKALVELHGGTISALSEGRGKGASFRIQLPLVAPVAGAETLAPVFPPRRVLPPLHILLVEDHGVTAKIMQSVLVAEGHRVERAGDVATAIQLADNNAFDLLLSDLGLPDGSGHDLMRQLRGRGHRFPAIALSGYGQEEDIRRSRQAGFAAHLIKPASREAVVEAIASVMNEESTKAADEVPPALPADMPVFEAHTALKLCLGDPELLSQMIRCFIEDCETILPQIDAALVRSELPEMGRLAHRLKGTIVHLGAELAAEAAAGVERAGLYGNDRSEAEESVRWLERECQVLKSALTDYQAAATIQT
jgi:signal transduction histidine kinase/ActR/RegA family two-component response regulator